MKWIFFLLLTPFNMIFANDVYDLSIESISIHDSVFEVKYKITNNSDKDVWFCKEIGYGKDDRLSLIEEKEKRLLVVDISQKGINPKMDYEEGLNIKYYRISSLKSETFVQTTKISDKINIYNIEAVNLRLGYYESFPKKFKEISKDERKINIFQKEIDGEKVAEKIRKHKFSPEKKTHL